VKNNKNLSAIDVLKLEGPSLPLDAEFPPKAVTEVFQRHALSFGRCFGSKSGYRAAHPEGEFIPNANVFSETAGKEWWGDLDLRVDKPALRAIAKELGRRLYVLHESDGRFEQALQSHAEVVEKAVWHTGGPTRVPDVAGFLERSGFTRVDAAYLLRVLPHRLIRPQGPKTALEIGRRLRALESAFARVGTDAGHKKWGLWWTLTNDKLAGQSPIEVLKAGGTLDIMTLTEPTMEMVLFAIKVSSWTLI
jgi:hypothetical protein